MSDKDKEICQNLAEAMPRMSEFDKGYILGLAEAAAKNADQEEQKKD